MDYITATAWKLTSSTCTIKLLMLWHAKTQRSPHMSDPTLPMPFNFLRLLHSPGLGTGPLDSIAHPLIHTSTSPAREVCDRSQRSVCRHPSDAACVGVARSDMAHQATCHMFHMGHIRICPILRMHLMWHGPYRVLIEPLCCHAFP